MESLDLLDSIAYGGTNNERWSEGLGTSPTEAEWANAVGRLVKVDIKTIDAAIGKVDFANCEFEAALETFKIEGGKQLADYEANRSAVKDRASVTKIEATIAWIFSKFSDDSVAMRSKVQPQKRS